MATYVVTMSHLAVSCPIFNEDVKKRFSQGFARKGEAAKKHKVKVLVACVAVLEHLIFYVVEAPSQSAVEEYLKEVELAFNNNIQIREVQLSEDAVKRYGLT